MREMMGEATHELEPHIFVLGCVWSVPAVSTPDHGRAAAAGPHAATCAKVHAARRTQMQCSNRFQVFSDDSAGGEGGAREAPGIEPEPGTSKAASLSSARQTGAGTWGEEEGGVGTQRFEGDLSFQRRADRCGEIGGFGWVARQDTSGRVEVESRHPCMATWRPRPGGTRSRERCKEPRRSVRRTCRGGLHEVPEPPEI